MPIEIPTDDNTTSSSNPRPQTTAPQQTSFQQLEAERAEQVQDLPIDDVQLQNNPLQNDQPTRTQGRLDGVVCIADQSVPIIVLYGPTSCGKSMTLVRMTKFLRSLGDYTVQPDRTFRPAYDTDFIRDCDNFDALVGNPMAAPPTTGYMLVDVIKDNSTVCKILEAPGEYYFDPRNPNRLYLNYLNTIIQSPNQKIWCIFVEPTNIMETSYVERVVDGTGNGFISSMRESDSVIILFNKIDKTRLSKHPGEWDMKKAKKYVDRMYPKLFNAFKEDIPILKIFKPYRCYFEPFTTGKFDGEGLYSESPDEWSERLWKRMKKLL